MQQILIGIILILGLGGYWLYNENQTLSANNMKLEAAVIEQQAAMEALRESYEKQGKALMNMSRKTQRFGFSTRELVKCSPARVLFI